MPPERRAVTSAERGPVREIAWRELFPWLSLVGTVRLAMQFRILATSALAVFLTLAGWWLLAKIFSNGLDDSWRAAYQSCPWESNPSVERGAIPLPTPPGDISAPPLLGQFPRQPFLDGWWQLSAPARQIFLQGLDVTKFVFLLLCTLWAAAVWAFFGGAITRFAAMQLA